MFFILGVMMVGFIAALLVSLVIRIGIITTLFRIIGGVFLAAFVIGLIFFLL